MINHTLSFSFGSHFIVFPILANQSAMVDKERTMNTSGLTQYRYIGGELVVVVVDYFMTLAADDEKRQQ